MANRRRTIIQKFLDGEINVNEFTVYVAVTTLADRGQLSTTTPELATRLGKNTLSRHAVARSLRSLQEKELIAWNTQTGTRNSTISVL